MRTHFYSSARAALTGGDGMVEIGQHPASEAVQIRYFLERYLLALTMSYEEWIAAQEAFWWQAVLGYDPQRLLPAPTEGIP